MLRLIQHKGFQIALLLGLYFLSSPYLPLEAHQILYTISIVIKELLVWIMPLVVIFFIASTVGSFERKAPLFIVCLLGFEFLSNFMSTWYAYGFGNLFLGSMVSFDLSEAQQSLDPLWHIPLTKPLWWNASRGCIFGLFMGCVDAFFKIPFLHVTIRKGKEVAEWVLTRVFAHLIPFFILGFTAYLNRSGFFTSLTTGSGIFVIGLVIALFFYIAFLFLWSARGKLYLAHQHAKNLIPATAVAFTSGCSLSTMPWTIQGTAKNLQDPTLASAIIPATTNIQQVGDCIANALMCFVLYQSFHGSPPTLAVWAPFTIAFALARYMTIGIRGGAIFIMLPIYETYLGFNNEMIALVLALNAVLDPIITSSNVVANGALCSVFERLWRKVNTFSCPTLPPCHFLGTKRR